MTTTHIDGLDRSVHETNVWLKEIAQEMGTEDRERAYIALRSTLHTYRDRLLPEQAAHLASHLPLLVRGVYYDGYSPAGKPIRTRDPDEFVGDVRNALSNIDGLEPIDAIRAVTRVMERHVGGGELHHLFHALPDRIEELVTDRRESR